jgi:hypothetical protein
MTSPAGVLNRANCETNPGSRPSLIPKESIGNIDLLSNTLSLCRVYLPMFHCCVAPGLRWPSGRSPLCFRCPRQLPSLISITSNSSTAKNDTRVRSLDSDEMPTLPMAPRAYSLIDTVNRSSRPRLLAGCSRDVKAKGHGFNLKVDSIGPHARKHSRERRQTRARA